MGLVQTPQERQTRRQGLAAGMKKRKKTTTRQHLAGQNSLAPRA
jgi:hypothetical protein